MSLTDLETHWLAVRSLLAIHTEEDYDRAVFYLNELVDEVGMDEAHSLCDLLDTLGTLLHNYEEAHYSLPNVSGKEMLRFFVEEHGLAQSDLPEIGSQGVVSEVLSGKRELNVRHVRALAERFGVSPAVFL